MREKQLRIIVTFQTTTDAMTMEKICIENSIPGRLIPVPREITAGCGMAWSAPPEAKDEVCQITKVHRLGISGIYEMMI